MANLITNSILLTYILVFIAACFKYHFRGWVWLACLFWLMFVMFGNIFFPGLSGLVKPTNLYLFPLYILLAAFFYPKRKTVYKQSPYLTNLLVSSKMQYSTLLIWLILIACLGKWMPNQASIIFYLSKMVLWQPIYWIGSQWLLMSLLFINHYAQKRQLSSQEILLLTLLWQFFYVFLNLQGIV